MKWFGGMADSFMTAFKSNVTVPFPSFHSRNWFSGQFRNVMAHMFSPRALVDSNKMLRVRPIEGLEKHPYLVAEWDKIVSQFPGLPRILDNENANELLRWIKRAADVSGDYGVQQGIPISARNMAASVPGQQAIEGIGQGTAASIKAGANQYPFSVSHMIRQYLGMKHPGGIRETTIGGPYLPVSPVGTVKKAVGTVAQRLGVKSKRMDRWADESILAHPTVMRVPGVQKSMGLRPDSEMLQSVGKSGKLETRMWGFVQGGYEASYAVEDSIRTTAWLKLFYDGVDPFEAAKRVSLAQISYKAKDFTAFENQILKRIIPFYSFTSRSIPWAMRQFFEEPGNILAQAIKGTKRTAEHLQGQIQHPGPVPPHIGDTLAIPMTSPEEGTKRFFTGVDVMDQDLWEIGVPLLEGKFGEAGFELAGRISPLLKGLVEGTTGTSLFQRGVEEGRPLRTMDPPLQRTWHNIQQTAKKWSGQEFDPGGYERLGRPTMLDNIVSNSPYTRYLSSTRTFFDPRKGIGAKAINLLTGAKIADVSLRAQESILREHLRAMIGETGGVLFEKATYPQEYLDKLKATDPAKYQQVMQIKALSDERAKVAKKMNEYARQGIPVGQALKD